MKQALRVGASLVLPTVALLFAGPVSAQSDLLLDEIVVTARKKSENLQDVPVSVTAISASTLEDLAIQDLSDVSKITAGLLFDNEFSRQSNRPVIRGQANILGDSGVSYFIDGVYITGSISDYDLNDIERLEVVKGPQSALYGRNTYSGAINIITKSPGEELSGNLGFEFAEDGQFETSAAIRGPIIPGLVSGGINLRKYEFDGAFTNTFDGSDIGVQESTSASAVLEFTPGDNWNIRFRAYYADLLDGQSPLFHQSSNDNNCFEDNGGFYRGLGRYYCGVVSPGEINTDVSVQAPNARLESEQLQTSLSVEWTLSKRSTLTSITGYNRADSIDISDGDYQPTSFQPAIFTPGGIPLGGPVFGFVVGPDAVDFTFAGQEELEDVSQEFRYAFEADGFELLLGAYYFKQNDEDRGIRTPPANAGALVGANFGAKLGELCSAITGCFVPVPFGAPSLTVPRDYNRLEIENKALFALVGIELTDTLNLTLEGRFQDEEITQRAIVRDVGTAAADVVRSTATASFDSFSPRVTLDWKFNDSSMLYVLYAEGTKPGGFNGTVAIEAGLPTFEEEEVSSVEFGLKNTWFDGQLNANFALFLNSVDGYQLTQNVRAGANTTSATVNAGDADINGFETEILYRSASIDGLTVTANYAYTDAEFSTGLDQNQGVLNDAEDNGLVDCSTGDQFPELALCTSLFGSIDGKKVPRTAEHQAFIDLDFRREFGNGSEWEWFTGINLSYESSKYSQVHNQAETGNTTLMSARFGFANERFNINFWGKNLLGEDSSPLVLRYADGAESFRRSFVGTLRRDTYFGVNANAKF